MQQTSEQLYDQWHTKLPVDSDINTPWHNFVKNQLVTNGGLHNKKVLEIGCGRGGFSLFLSSIATGNTEIVAADFSEAAVNKGAEYASSLHITNIKWMKADIQNITFPDNYFDIVISCETIEHVPNPLKGVKELGRVLKPGGKLILTTPNYMGLFGLYRGYLRITGRKWTEMGQPINNFTMIPRTLGWLRKSGITGVKFESEIISVPFPGKRKVLHFNVHKPRWIWKWFGLQSFFTGVKKS